MTTSRPPALGRSLRLSSFALAAMVSAGALTVPIAPTAQAATTGLERVKHVVVLFQENWSFDSLLPYFPDADDLRSGMAPPQVDSQGRPYPALPQPVNNNLKPAALDDRFPANLPNAPFDTGKYVAVSGKTGDLAQGFYQEQKQIDGGRMDRFVSAGNAGALPMSYYDSNALPLGDFAAKYTLTDHFFHAAYGGSFNNAMWLVCACSARFPSAPPSMVAKLAADGSLLKDGPVTPDGYAVGTVYSTNQPHPAGTDPAALLPSQAMPTIGDRLSSKGVSWAWYSGGYNDALAGHPDPLFQFHHQPFVYYANYADGTPGKAQHLKDETDFLAAARRGSLPAVSFVKPLGPDNEHPGYADELRGQAHIADLIKTLQAGPDWQNTVIVWTYDENGGRWDHVSPPAGDRWGPGTRIPTVVISPLARRGFVDHTTYDTTSILKMIETRWGLTPLGTRDAQAANLANTLQPVAAGKVSGMPLGDGTLILVLVAGAVLAAGAGALGWRLRRA